MLVGREYIVDPNKPRSRRAKLILTISVVTNLSLLGFFKYFNFGVENYDALIDWIGLPQLRLDTALRVTLPLGISFYTFESMSYVIDVYRGQARAIRNIVDFAAFVSMFPQLVAGPIIRFSEIADQIRSRTHTVTKFTRGVAFFSLGMTKKVLLANPCGKIADLAFESGSLSMARRLVRRHRLCLPDLLRFQRLLGHGDRARPDDGIRVRQEFRFAVQVAIDHRILAALAHFALDLLARLSVPAARREPQRSSSNLRQPPGRHADWRTVARRLVEFSGVGRAAWRAAGVRADARQGRHLQPLVSRRSASAFTFVLVLVSWVFFRASDLPTAMRYLSDMAGQGAIHAGAMLLDGVVYQPYYLGTFLIAGIVTWGCPQTWDWTRTLTAAEGVRDCRRSSCSRPSP